MLESTFGTTAGEHRKWLHPQGREALARLGREPFPARRDNEPVKRATPFTRLGPALLVALALAACSDSPPALETTVGAGGGSPFAADGSPLPRASDAPRAIAFDPPQGATDVDPARTTLSVTFDRAMDREGWAWVVEAPETAPEIGESRWDETLRVNTATVRLQPGRTYVVWVNSSTYSYFRDQTGAPAHPVRWTFSTAPAAGAAAPSPVAAHPTRRLDAPQVLALSPPNGARDVDAAAVTELRVQFDRPMAEGWSWVTEGGSTFPPMAGKAYQTPDGRAAALPVRLEPGHTYVVWLNSQQYDGFRSTEGTPLPPLRWEFSTAAAPAR